MKERLLMRKEVTKKEDGRYIIYYHFEEGPADHAASAVKEIPEGSNCRQWAPACPQQSRNDGGEGGESDV